MTEDEKFMAEALRLGRLSSGITGDNPAVGAVLVQETAGGAQIIGRGATARGGRPHAETAALAQAGERALGATLYVSLEPCCHFGKTPPCAEALIKAGIARAVIAIADPDSRVCGGGIARLRQAGIKTELGCLAAEAARDLAPYLCRRKFSRPFITVKLALSADGCIGRIGEGQIALSGQQARQAVHGLRAAHDGVLIGIGTAASDNPRLDCRLLPAAAGSAFAQESLPRIEAAALPRGALRREAAAPARLVLDTELRLPYGGHLRQSAAEQPVMLLCGQAALKQSEDKLAAGGCVIIRSEAADGQINLPQALRRLFAMGIKSLFVEGGARVIQSFWDKGLVDQLILFRTAKIIGKNGYKKPDFGAKTGYEKLAEQDIGADKAEVWLHLWGKAGLLGD